MKLTGGCVVLTWQRKIPETFKLSPLCENNRASSLRK